MTQKIRPLVPVPSNLEERFNQIQQRQVDNKEDYTLNFKPLEGFIYLSSIGVYFAKERTHLGQGWNETKNLLKEQGLFMPNPHYFAEFLFYLLQNPTIENKKIYEDITKKGNLRTQWLDAVFKRQGFDIDITYEIKNTNGKLEEITEELSKITLPKIEAINNYSLDYYLKKRTLQGLPTSSIKSIGDGDFYYYPPTRNISVAVSGASTYGYFLDCDNIGYADSGRGVFAAKLP